MVEIDDIPTQGILVVFEVTSGPNAGLTSIPNNGECFPNNCVTDANGQVSWTYSSLLLGTDIIEAKFDGFQTEIVSNTVEKIWEALPIPTLSEWGLIAFAGILGLISFYYYFTRRKQVTS